MHIFRIRLTYQMIRYDEFGSNDDAVTLLRNQRVDGFAIKKIMTLIRMNRKLLEYITKTEKNFNPFHGIQWHLILSVSQIIHFTIL